MRKKLQVLIFITFLSSLLGCATHDIVRQPALNVDMQAQANKVSQSNVELMAKAFYTKPKLEQYFANDLLKYGILPVQINLLNKSKSNLVLDAEAISIVDITGNSFTPMSLDQVFSKCKKSYWRTAGWTVLGGIFGIIPSAINVSRVNKKIRADYEARSLKSGNLISGGVTDGIVFFLVPKELNTLSGMVLKTPLFNRLTSDTILLSYSFSGFIPIRKPEGEEAKEGEEAEVSYEEYAKKELPAIKEKIKIVLLEFKSPDHLKDEAIALTNLTSHTLYHTNCFDIITQEDVNEVIKEHKLQAVGFKDNVVQIGKMMAAQGMIIGNLDKVGNEFWILIRMIDVETAKVILSKRLTYKGDIADISPTYTGYIKMITSDILENQKKKTKMSGV